MSIAFHCTHCNKKIEAQDTAGGKWGKCPSCHNKVYIPGLETEEEIDLAPIDTNEEQKKKLIAGIVLTGGGSQLLHLKQLVEYITGMDTRVGFPNEHMAGDSDSETTSPMYATAVGLVLNRLDNYEIQTDISEFEDEDKDENIEIDAELEEKKNKKKKNRFFENWAEKFKDFLDKAE